MATQVLNINVPVPEASKDSNGSYEWMSVRAGAPSQFDKVKFNAPINQNAQMLYGNADLPNYVEIAKVDNDSANVSVIAVGGTYQDLNNAVPYNLVQKQETGGTVYNPVNLANGQITVVPNQQGRGYYRILVSAGGNVDVTGVQFRISKNGTLFGLSESTAITVQSVSVNPNGTVVILTMPPNKQSIVAADVIKLQVTSSTTNDLLWIRSVDLLLASSA